MLQVHWSVNPLAAVACASGKRLSFAVKRLAHWKLVLLDTPSPGQLQPLHGLCLRCGTGTRWAFRPDTHDLQDQSGPRCSRRSGVTVWGRFQGRAESGGKVWEGVMATPLALAPSKCSTSPAGTRYDRSARWCSSSTFAQCTARPALDNLCNGLVADHCHCQVKVGPVDVWLRAEQNRYSAAHTTRSAWCLGRICTRSGSRLQHVHKHPS